MKNALFIILILFFCNTSFSQEIAATVYCNIEQVPAANKDYVLDFNKRVENYINNYRWIGKNYGEDKVKVSMQIVFVSATSDNIYTAKVVIESQRPIYNGDKKSGKFTKMIRFLDEKWEFAYQKDQPLDHEELRFDPLTSFLDYYMNIVLGYDSDTYDKELSGTPLFERAQKIVMMASGSSKFSGWKKALGGAYGRFDLVDELLNPNFIPVRKAFFNYHYNGLDLKSTDKESAFSSALKALEDIAATRKKMNTTSIVIRNFFDLRNQEIADFFSDYPEKSIFKKLIDIDKAHYKVYEEQMKKR